MDLHEDIFFLSIDEMLAALAGDETALQFIAKRKENYERIYAHYIYRPPSPDKDEEGGEGYKLAKTHFEQNM